MLGTRTTIKKTGQTDGKYIDLLGRWVDLPGCCWGTGPGVPAARPRPGTTDNGHRVRVLYVRTGRTLHEPAILFSVNMYITVLTPVKRATMPLIRVATCL